MSIKDIVDEIKEYCKNGYKSKEYKKEEAKVALKFGFANFGADGKNDLLALLSEVRKFLYAMCLARDKYDPTSRFKVNVNKLMSKQTTFNFQKLKNMSIWSKKSNWCVLKKHFVDLYSSVTKLVNDTHTSLCNVFKKSSINEKEKISYPMMIVFVSQCPWYIGELEKEEMQNETISKKNADKYLENLKNKIDETLSILEDTSGELFAAINNLKTEVKKLLGNNKDFA